MSNKFENLINDEIFISKLENAKSDEEVITLFKANGIEVSIDEIKEMALDLEAEELEEDSLDNVSGGAVAYIIGYAAARWLKNRSSQGGGNGALGFSGGGSR